MASMFDSERDQVLDAMASNGWATASDGDVDLFGAWFAYIVNEGQDVAMGNGEFVSLFESMDFDFELSPELCASLIGSFTLVTLSDGSVRIERVAEHEARAWYAGTLAAFQSAAEQERRGQ